MSAPASAYIVLVNVRVNRHRFSRALWDHGVRLAGEVDPALVRPSPKVREEYSVRCKFIGVKICAKPNGTRSACQT